MVVDFVQSGAVVRVGIYDDTGASYPQAILSQSAPATAASGANTFLIPPVLLQNGVDYWLALGVDPGSPNAEVSWHSGVDQHRTAVPDLPSPFPGGAPPLAGSLTQFAIMDCP
jgi:hypothetical protein